MPHLLSSFFTRACAHQFAWPRRTADGTFYQVCLECGDCFSYDWDAMTRGDRIDTPPEPTAAPRRVWKPRSRRLRWQKPILYRESGTTEWIPGQLQNISESGVSFTGEQPLGAGLEIEMIFVMPTEITGQPNSKVLCRAEVVRVVTEKAHYAHAVVTSGYSFLPDD